MPDANIIISESLAPAVAISGIGLLILGLNSRIATVGLRIRDLNRELRQSIEPSRRTNIRHQVPLMVKRARFIRNAIFLLFGSLGMMVFTSFAIAISELHYVEWAMVPSWSFLGGLILMLAAAVIEVYETSLNMKCLKLDVANSLDIASHMEHDVH